MKELDEIKAPLEAADKARRIRDATRLETYVKNLDDINAALDAADEARRLRDDARERVTQRDTPEHRAALEEAERDLAERTLALEPVLDTARSAINTEAHEVKRKREALDREIVHGPWTKPLNDLIGDREALLLEEQLLTGKTRAEIGPLPAGGTHGFQELKRPGGRSPLPAAKDLT